MHYPLRDNLEVRTVEGTAWIRCTKCSHLFCQLGENWRNVCKKRILPVTKGGPLMKELAGQFVLEQLYCPGCRALLNTELVEERKDGEEGRAQ